MSIGIRRRVSKIDNDSDGKVSENGPMPTRIHHKNRRPAHVYLAEWLALRKLTAEQLAGRLEISKSVISKLMNGHQPYTIPLLQAIAYALDCEVAQLLRPPLAPTRDELLEKASPEDLRRALELIETVRKTGTDS
jgi:transcriptional regulator with XRE-family HTH domain